MEALRKILDRLLEYVCCILLALMTVFATWQVLSRYIFNKPSTVTEELVLISFVWMGLLGAAYVFGKREHMRMSFLVDKLNDRNRAILDLISEIIIILFASSILVFGGIKISQLSMGQLSSSLQLPMGYIYLAIPLSGVITIVYNIMNIFDIIKKISSKNNQLELQKVVE